MTNVSPPAVWRLIPPLHAPGSIQMAIDWWLLEQHRQHSHPPTLRFYTWLPISISLGYHQRQWSAHWQHLSWQGQPITLVRRPTGGRSVLHQGDLTYMVVTSGVEGNRTQMYQTLCSFLIQGWQNLGVSLSYGQQGRGNTQNQNCFGIPTSADLVMEDGTKLIGSARLHRGHAILQHGSIRLRSNPDLFFHVFQEKTSLPHFPMELNGKEPLNDVMEALILAACHRFHITLDTQPLREEEWKAIEQLAPSFVVPYG